jgi:hypothetical protein
MNMHSEKKTIEFMVRYYCRSRHKSGHPCSKCGPLLDYALRRLDSCRYGDDKPSCRKCRTHCYAPVEREAVRRIMRYVGPRMLFAKPLELLRHYLKR